MCLSLNAAKTKEIREKFRKSGKSVITVYKKFKINYPAYGGNEITLRTPFMYATVKVDKKGYFNSNRNTTKLTQHELRRGEIAHGIHVYLNKNENTELVPVKVHVKDFIATDSRGHHAVFTRIKLDKKAQRYITEDVANSEVQNILLSIDGAKYDIKSYKDEIRNNLNYLKTEQKELIRLQKRLLVERKKAKKTKMQLSL